MPTETVGIEEGTLAPGAYDELVEQFKWVYALATILLEHQGGSVKITRELLESHTFATRVSVTKDELDDTFVVEVVRD